MNKDIMRAVGLGDHVKAMEDGKCPLCLKPIIIGDFRDLISLREFEISGMCQVCQDKTFR